MINFKLLTVAFLSVVLLSGCNLTPLEKAGVLLVGGAIAVNTVAGSNDNSSQGGNKYETELVALSTRNYCKDTYDSDFMKEFMKKQEKQCNLRATGYRNFKKSYISLNNYNAKQASDLQKLVDQRFFLQMKKSNGGLKTSEERKLSGLIQKEVTLERKINSFDARRSDLQRKVLDAQNQYTNAGGELDLEVLFTYENKRAGRYNPNP